MGLIRRVLTLTTGLWSFRRVAAASMDPLPGFIATEDLQQQLEPCVSGLGEKWVEFDQRQKLVHLNFIATALWHLMGLPLELIPDLQVGTMLVRGTNLEQAAPGIEGDYPDGRFDPANNRIHINETMMAIFVDALETLAHELRHGFQNHHIDRLNKGLSCHPESSQWKKEFLKPANPFKNYVEYSNQCVEVDSNRFANQVCRAVDRIGGG